MFIRFEEIGGNNGSVEGELQGDHVGYEITNMYNSPFEAHGKGLAAVATQVLSGGFATTKMQYMFSQYWESAIPPTVDLTVGFIAQSSSDDVHKKVNTLHDMFAVHATAGIISPPGAITFSTGGAKAAYAALWTGDLSGLENVFKYTRYVNMYLSLTSGGTSLKITQMLPERFSPVGAFPLMVDGKIGVFLVQCTFKKTGIATVGDYIFET